MDTPWQSDNFAGIQSQAFALNQGTFIGPNPKTVFLLRLVNGWYEWNLGDRGALFGRDPRGIAGGRYTGQQGAFLRQVANSTFSSGGSNTDTMRWTSPVGIPSTSRGDGWFVAFSDHGYTRYTVHPTDGIVSPDNVSYFTLTEPQHLHAVGIPLGSGVTATFDIEMHDPVAMGDVIDPMKDVFADASANLNRFLAVAAGTALGLGFNDFPFTANEFDVSTIDTSAYDGRLISGVTTVIDPTITPGAGGATDCSFYIFVLNGGNPGILMAQSEVAVNTNYILVDYLQFINPTTGSLAYTFLSVSQSSPPPNGKAIIPIPDMTLFPEVAGSLFSLEWFNGPYPNGIVRHLIPGHTIASWEAAGRPSSLT